MMRRLLQMIAIAVALVGGGAWLFDLEVPGLPWPSGFGGSQAPPDRRSPALERGHITVASFNVQVFGQSKLGKPEAMRIIADVVRQFDVVAIQEIRSREQNVMPELVRLVNQTGVRYDYIIGPRLGRTSSQEQYAYIYDTASLECDHQTAYTVSDPDDLLHREPHVAAFRVRGLPANEAFTFTLVNIHTDPDEVDLEINVLDDVFRAVRRDGRGEDDIILLGDLNADDRSLGELGQMPNILWVIQDQPTNTRGTAQYDNILFDQQATREYLGKAGVFDLQRHYRLTEAEALEVSDHYPVWAQFNIYESGLGEQFARVPGATARSR